MQLFSVMPSSDEWLQEAEFFAISRGDWLNQFQCDFHQMKSIPMQESSWVRAQALRDTVTM